MQKLQVEVYVDGKSGADVGSASEYVTNRITGAARNVKGASVLMILRDDQGNLVRTVMDGKPTPLLQQKLDELS